ncbi:MAG: hypothetical protein KUG59_00520 [Parvibaculaceae bacterium]|nr:hypothetical protein [Parvibaculaceae bacterium]
MSTNDTTTLDISQLDGTKALQVCTETLGELWQRSVEFIESSFPTFLKLAGQIWQSWLTLFPRNDVWDPWGAALVMIFVVLLITHQVQKLVTPA